MNISILDSEREMKLLASVALAADSWGRLVNLHGKQDFYVHLQAPIEALELNSCSYHALSWLWGKNDWMLVKFDGSNSMRFPERFILAQLSVPELAALLKNENPSLFFDCYSSGLSSVEVNLKIASIIFHGLIFQGHCWVTASATKNGRRLAIQDGYLYFISNSEADILEANKIVDLFEKNRLSLPDWISMSSSYIE